MPSTEAEDLVARALIRQNWSILARNFRHVGCELDIVAKKGETLIVVEVKARRFAPKSDADMSHLLPAAKRRALLRGASVFITKFGTTHQAIRFDLALVTGGTQGMPAKLAYFVQAF